VFKVQNVVFGTFLLLFEGLVPPNSNLDEFSLVDRNDVLESEQ
jgi:hypothetical protein